MNPFLGARPYGAADDKLFFGRDFAVARLVERIDLHPLTILTSPSGLGKTSLLRARVLPELEKMGLSPVYLRPDPPGDSGRDGQAAAALLDGRLVTAIALTLLPDPELEAKAIDQVCKRAPPSMTLRDAPAWFDNLPVADPVRAEILGSPDGTLEQLSMLARYLRGTLALRAMERQATAMKATMLAGLLRSDTLLSDIKTAFCDEKSNREKSSTDESAGEEFARGAAGARALVLARGSGGPQEGSAPLESELDAVLGPLTRLCRTVEGVAPLLVRPDGDAKLSVRIVLVIDQLEQLFTLSRSNTCAEALTLLAELLNAQAPVHLVLSLRKEWYADLAREFARYFRMTGPQSRTTYYLEAMTREEALEVMEKAPSVVGASPMSPDQTQSIWNLLQVDSTIDAVVLSIACYEQFASGAAPDLAITEDSIMRLFTSYLSRALGAFSDEVERNEALDVLGALCGSGATRDFVTHTRLIKAPLRDPALRKKVIDGLQKAFLIKGDNPARSHEKIYDIMHERLLSPVRQLVDSQPAVALFREAADRISQLDAPDQGLSWRHCAALLASNRSTVWDSRSAGILLSSLLREMTPGGLTELQQTRTGSTSMNPGETRVPDWLRDWLRKLAEACSQRVPADEEISTAERGRMSWWLSAEEIRSSLAGEPDDQTVELALQSGVRGPAGWMRPELRALALRLGGGQSVP